MALPKPNPKHASIRTRNPGAQWPNTLAKQFGMTGYETLRDGENNRIAIFPTAVQGAASNMALLDHGYCGLSIEEAEEKWSGQKRGGLPGFNSATVITHNMFGDPAFMISFMKATANAEAPNGANALTDAEWRQAFDLYRSTIYGTSAPVVAKKPPATPDAPQPSLWSRIIDLLFRRT